MTVTSLEPFRYLIRYPILGKSSAVYVLQLLYIVFFTQLTIWNVVPYGKTAVTFPTSSCNDIRSQVRASPSTVKNSYTEIILNTGPTINYLTFFHYLKFFSSTRIFFTYTVWFRRIDFSQLLSFMNQDIFEYFTKVV